MLTCRKLGRKDKKTNKKYDYEVVTPPWWTSTFNSSQVEYGGMSLYEYWYPLVSITEWRNIFVLCHAYFIQTGFLWYQTDQAKSWWIDLVFSDKGTEACKKDTFLALQEKGCVQITKLTGSLLSNLKGISRSSLWAHHLWRRLPLWMRMKAYSTYMVLQ